MRGAGGARAREGGGAGRGAARRGWAAAAAGLGAVLLALAWAGPAAAQGGASCDVCKNAIEITELFTAVTDASAATRGHYACTVARWLACDEGGLCWISNLMEYLLRGIEAVVMRVPQLIGEYISIMFMAAILLIMTLQWGYAFVAQAGWNDAVERLVVTAAVAVVAVWLQTGGTEAVWRLAGVTNAATVSIGLGIREATTEAAVFKDATAGGTGMRRTVGCEEIDVADKELGWPQAREGIRGLVRDVSDVAAIAVGVGLTFLPDLRAFFSGLTEISMETLHQLGNVVFEAGRVLVAYILIRMALGIFVAYVGALVEGLVIAGIAIALLPIVIWMVLWKATREGVMWCLGSIMYCAMLLLAAGITVMIARLAVAVGMNVLAKMSWNKDYVGVDIVNYGCVADPTTQLKGVDLYRDFSQHVCAVSLPLRGGEYASALSGPMLENMAHWLPGFIMVMAGLTLATAVLNYTKTAAGEITGQARTLGSASRCRR